MCSPPGPDGNLGDFENYCIAPILFKLVWSITEGLGMLIVLQLSRFAFEDVEHQRKYVVEPDQLRTDKEQLRANAR